MAGLVALTLAPARAVTQSEKQTAASTQTTDSQSNSTGKKTAPDRVDEIWKVSTQAPDSQSNTTGERGASGLDRALIRAAAAGDLAGIEELLRAGANVNCTVSPGEIGSPLVGAARKGQLDAVRLLLDRGADPNLEPGDGTPLINAALEGHVDVVSLLLDRGAIMDQIFPVHQNALIRASGKGRLEVVKLLVARGADVNARALAPAELQWVEKRIMKDGRTEVKKFTAVPLETAPKRKIEERKRKDGVTSTKAEWRTPLSMAERGGHKDVVDFLLASGARE